MTAAAIVFIIIFAVAFVCQRRSYPTKLTRTQREDALEEYRTRHPETK